MAAAQLSERRAGHVTGFARATHRDRPRREDAARRARLETLAVLKPRWGYRRLHWLLVREGWPVNHKRVQRVYGEAGRTVRKRRRQRVSVARVPSPTPSAPNARWSIDFMHDTLGDGRAIRLLPVVDDCTRACPVIVVDRAWPAARVTRELDALQETIGLPRAIVCDNGSECTSQTFDQWAHARGITLVFSRPGHPVDTAFAENFNGRVRDECLNQSWLVDLRDAQRTIEAWRLEYNEARPHTGLAGRTPAEFAQAYDSMTPFSTHDR